MDEGEITENTSLLDSAPDSQHRAPENPCNFLSNKSMGSIFCSNEVTLGMFLEGG